MLGTIVNAGAIILGGSIGLVFKKGEILYKVSEDKLVDALIEEIEKN